MSQKINNAKSLYLEGIRDGNYREAIEKYTGDRYTQHSTGVKDGKEGFIEFFQKFICNHPKRDIQIIHAIEDGQYVFLHVYQNLDDGKSEWVTADFFDTDENDRIIEHWDVIEAYKTIDLSGVSSIDDATEVVDLDKTETNKEVVRNLIKNIVTDLFLLVGQGNFVATLSRSEQEGQPSAQVDIFKLENKLVIEHWDIVEPILPKSEWVNSGKF